MLARPARAACPCVETRQPAPSLKSTARLYDRVVRRDLDIVSALLGSVNLKRSRNPRNGTRGRPDRPRPPMHGDILRYEYTEAPRYVEAMGAAARGWLRTA